VIYIDTIVGRRGMAARHTLPVAGSSDRLTSLR